LIVKGREDVYEHMKAAIYETKRNTHLNVWRTQEFGMEKLIGKKAIMAYEEGRKLMRYLIVFDHI